MAAIFLVKLRGLTLNNISKQHHRISLPRFISSTQGKDNYNNGGEGNNKSDRREEGEGIAGTRLFSSDDAAKEAQEALERKYYSSSSSNHEEEDSIVEELHKIDGPVDTVEYRNIDPNVVEETK